MPGQLARCETSLTQVLGGRPQQICHARALFPGDVAPDTPDDDSRLAAVLASREIGRGRDNLEAAYPRLPLLWLDTEDSEAEVFWIAAADLPWVDAR